MLNEVFHMATIKVRKLGKHIHWQARRSNHKNIIASVLHSTNLTLHLSSIGNSNSSFYILHFLYIFVKYFLIKCAADKNNRKRTDEYSFMDDNISPSIPCFCSFLYWLAVLSSSGIIENERLYANRSHSSPLDISKGDKRFLFQTYVSALPFKKLFHALHFWSYLFHYCVARSKSFPFRPRPFLYSKF